MPDLDLFNAFWKRTEQEQAWRSYAPTVRKARPFSLDDDMSDVVGQLALSTPADLRKFLISAKLPYPIMWLEADFASGLGKFERTEGHEFWMTKSAPQRVGWLLATAPNGSITATRVARVEDPVLEETGEAMMYPITYVFSGEHKLSIDDATFRSLEGTIHPEVLRAIRNWNRRPIAGSGAWGWEGKLPASRERFIAGKSPERTEEIETAFRASPLFETSAQVIEPRAVLRLLNAPALETLDSHYDRTINLLMAGYNDQYGDLAFIVSALALLNEVPYTEVPFRPSGHIRAGGSLRPFMQTSIVSIEMPAKRRRLKDIRDALKHPGEGRVRARHEVRGHWRHMKRLPRAAADNHRWERWVDRAGRPCWRTWIPNHARGSGQLGFVHQTYEVVRGRGSIPGVEGELDVGTH